MGGMSDDLHRFSLCVCAEHHIICRCVFSKFHRHLVSADLDDVPVLDRDSLDGDSAIAQSYGDIGLGALGDDYSVGTGELCGLVVAVYREGKVNCLLAGNGLSCQ